MNDQLQRYVLEVDYNRDHTWHEVDNKYAVSRRVAVELFKGTIEDAQKSSRNWRVVRRER